MKWIYGLLLLGFLSACSTGRLYKKPAFSPSKEVYAVIEIPAGTNHKIEYDVSKKRFVNDKKDGKERVINFLPYPGNYGFIPSTYMDPEEGGDGDALDILVLSESLKTASLVEVIPLGILKFLDDGEIDYKLIAVPANPADRIINALTLKQFSEDYPKVKEMVEDWFMHYKDPGRMNLIGWGDEHEAIEEILKWMAE